MTGTESDTERLARAIIDMAEKDKGLVLSKLEDLIGPNISDAYDLGYDLGYDDGYDDGYEDAAEAVETGALVERSAIPKSAFDEILNWKPKREATDTDKAIRIIPHNDRDTDAAKVLEYAANLPEVKQELHDSLDAALESLMNTYPKPSLTIVKRK